MNSEAKNSAELILSAARGVYIPRDFLTNDYEEVDTEYCAAWGLTEENMERWIYAANPDSENYWQSWEWVLDNAKYVCEDGSVFTLYQDGDLWALCYKRMTDEEKQNFGFDE